MISLLRWLLHEIHATLPSLVVLAGAFITAGFALEQVRGNNIRNARIEWLKELKTRLSAFILSATRFAYASHRLLALEKKFLNKNEGEYLKSKEKFIDDLNKAEDEMQANLNVIILNLNPREIAHQKLSELLREFVFISNVISTQAGKEIPTNSHDRFNETEKAIIDLSQLILKLEWEQAKRSEFSYWCYMKFGQGRQLKKDAESFT